MNRLFAYGTINLDRIQEYLWGEAKSGKVATLQDHKLYSYESNIFFVQKEFGETVAGKIYELTEEQLERTDAYEGRAYERSTVNIDGKPVYVYVRSSALGRV